MSVMDQAQLLIERQECLRLIIRAQFGYILRRANIKKDLIIGLVGERGGGKSGSGAVLALVDFMLDGIPVYSNMHICCDIEVDDITARKNNLSQGGIAHFESRPLDLKKLLRFDPVFGNSLIFIDEVNVEISEARRSMTNTNLFSNRLAQELRHLQSSLIFTCVSEMYTDGRLRELADCFCKSSDTANTSEGIKSGKPPGIDFRWIMYFMTGCFDGTTYYETKKPAGTLYFHFKPFHGIYNDKEFQGQGMLKYGVDFKHSGSEVSIDGVQVQNSPVVVEHHNQWSWLEDILKAYSEAGVVEIPSETIWNHPEAVRRKVYKNRITQELENTYRVFADYRWESGERFHFYKLDSQHH